MPLAEAEQYHTQYYTVFKSYGNERLAEWRAFRQQLETSETPLTDLAVFWANAPFVNQYINPYNVKSWPDPWHLILDDKYDDLGVALGMLYTVKLTQRFIDTPCEIHTSTLPNERTPRYSLVVDKKYVLNWDYKEVVKVENLPEVVDTRILWAGSGLL
jgi:hypothetical protein